MKRVDCDQILRKMQEKPLSFLLKMYIFLYLQFIELWDPACCQSLHVWICKTGYLQAGLCQQWAGQSWYCWKSRLGFEENNTSHHSDIWSKRAVHKDLQGDLPYLQEEDRNSEQPITSQWAVFPEQSSALDGEQKPEQEMWAWDLFLKMKILLGAQWTGRGETGIWLNTTVTKANCFPGCQQGWDDVRSLQWGQEED